MATPTLAVTTARINFVASYENAEDLATGTAPYSINDNNAYANGTGSNKANTVWSDSITLTAGNTDVHDLAGGLTDLFGNTITFTEIKGFIVINKNAVSGDKLEIGGNAGAKAFVNWVKAAGDIVHCDAGGRLLLDSPIDGWAVGAGATDELEIKAPGGNNVDYDIIIWGEA